MRVVYICIVQNSIIHHHLRRPLSCRIVSHRKHYAKNDAPLKVVGAREPEVRVRDGIDVLAEEFGWLPVLAIDPNVLRLEPLTRSFVGAAE